MPLDAAMGKLKERIPWIEGLYYAARNRRDCLETFNSRSKCRGVRARPAGLRGPPRPNDPRGSRRNGGSSEPRPRVKLDYRATTPRS